MHVRGSRACSVSRLRASAGPSGRGDQPRLRWLREVWESTIGKKVDRRDDRRDPRRLRGPARARQPEGLQGPAAATPAIDTYAEWLRTVGGPAIPREGVLWVVRAMLLRRSSIHVVGVAPADRAATAPRGRRATRRRR